MDLDKEKESAGLISGEKERIFLLFLTFEFDWNKNREIEHKRQRIITFGRSIETFSHMGVFFSREGGRQRHRKGMFLRVNM